MNSFGERFRLTTFGESHGAAVGGVIDGCPAGVRIDMELVAQNLARRRGDGQEGTTARREADEVEWLSGLLDGVTLGTPIAFMVRNCEARSEDYEALRDCYRPGHADYTYEQRYGLRDWRGGGRASGRETVARVVAGSVAMQLLMEQGITISAEAEMAEAALGEDGIFASLDGMAEAARREGETCGGTVRCTIEGVPAGVGNPVFGKLNALLASAMMSIPSAMGFEMGAGFSSAQMTGRQFADAWVLSPKSQSPHHNSQFTPSQFTIHNSQITPSQFSNHYSPKTVTNHCGGVQGGISNGMPICFRVAFHPVVTQPEGMDCLTAEGEIRHVVPGGRHDRFHVRRLPVIVESMAALCLAQYLL